MAKLYLCELVTTNLSEMLISWLLDVMKNGVRDARFKKN